MIYYIGGPSCAGKTTIAKMIAEKYNMYYFSADQHLKATLKSNKNKNTIKFILSDLRTLVSLPPTTQARLMISIYHEIFDSIISDIKSLLSNIDVIAEGTVFLPELMKNNNKYIIFIPSRNFLKKALPKRNYVRKESDNIPSLINNILKRTFFISQYINDISKHYNIPVFQNDNNLVEALSFAESSFYL